MSVELAAQGLSQDPQTPVSVRKLHARGRTHGLALIFWLLEQRRVTLVGLWLLAASPAALFVGERWWLLVAAWLAVPVATVLLPLLFLVYRSHQHDDGSASWEPFLE